MKWLLVLEAGLWYSMLFWLIYDDEKLRLRRVELARLREGFEARVPSGWVFYEGEGRV